MEILLKIPTYGHIQYVKHNTSKLHYHAKHKTNTKFKYSNHSKINKCQLVSFNYFAFHTS